MFIFLFVSLRFQSSVQKRQCCNQTDVVVVPSISNESSESSYYRHRHRQKIQMYYTLLVLYGILSIFTMVSFPTRKPVLPKWNLGENHWLSRWKSQCVVPMRSPCVALRIPKVHGHLGGDLEIEIFGGWWGWYPQIIHFKRVFHYKPSILEYHHFRKPLFDLMMMIMMLLMLMMMMIILWCWWWLLLLLLFFLWLSRLWCRTCLLLTPS